MATLIETLAYTSVPAQWLSRVQLFVTPGTIGCQAPLFMELSKQEYWSRLPFPTPGDFLNPGTEPVSLASPALAGRFSTISSALSKYPIQDTNLDSLVLGSMFLTLIL